MKKWQWVLFWVIVGYLLLEMPAMVGHLIHHAGHSIGVFSHSVNGG